MQMTVTSENALQLTLTKSSLGLAKSLLEDYTAKEEEGRPGVVEEVDFPAPETFDAIYCVKNLVRG